MAPTPTCRPAASARIQLSLRVVHGIQPMMQDRFSYGAYSYVPPDGKKAYYDWLGHPGEHVRWCMLQLSAVPALRLGPKASCAASRRHTTTDWGTRVRRCIGLRTVLG